MPLFQNRTGNPCLGKLNLCNKTNMQQHQIQRCLINQHPVVDIIIIVVIIIFFFFWKGGWEY